MCWATARLPRIGQSRYLLGSDIPGDGIWLDSHPDKCLVSRLRKQGRLNVKLPCGCLLWSWSVEHEEWRPAHRDVGPHTIIRAKTSSHQLRRWRLACGPSQLPTSPNQFEEARRLHHSSTSPMCVWAPGTNPCHTFGSGFPAPDLHMLDDERPFSGRLVMAQN